MKRFIIPALLFPAFALMGCSADPDVRRGLARTLTVLRSLGSQPAATPVTAPAALSPKE